MLSLMMKRLNENDIFQDVSASGCDSGVCSGSRQDQPHQQYPSCDSTSNVQINNSNDANNENHSRSSAPDKPVNLSFKNK